MELSLDPETRARIEEHVRSGKYARPEDVVAAALLTLDQQEYLADLLPGELAELLAEGERSIEQEGTLDGDKAFEERCARRAQRKQSP